MASQEAMEGLDKSGFGRWMIVTHQKGFSQDHGHGGILEGPTCERHMTYRMANDQWQTEKIHGGHVKVGSHSYNPRGGDEPIERGEVSQEPPSYSATTTPLNVMITPCQKNNDCKGTDVMRYGTILFSIPFNCGKPCAGSKRDVGDCSQSPRQQRGLFVGCEG